MATTALPAKSTAWTWGGTTVDQVTSFNGIGLTGGTIDVSDLSHTWRQFISSGLVEGKPVTMDVHWDPNNTGIHDTIQDDLISGTARTLQVTFADAGTTTYSCSAFCVDFDRTGSLESDLTGTITFQPTGTVTPA